MTTIDRLQPRWTSKELWETLAHACCADYWTRHPLARRMAYSSGVETLTEGGECFWLVDAIASHLLNPKLKAAMLADFSFRSLHLWELIPDGKGGAILECRIDTGRPAVVRQEIEYTDFPWRIEDGEPQPCKLYAGDDGEHYRVYLPSEY